MRDGVTGGGAAVVAGPATGAGVFEAGIGAGVCVAVSVGVGSGVLVTVGVEVAGGIGVKVARGVLTIPSG